MVESVPILMASRICEGSSGERERTRSMIEDLGDMLRVIATTSGWSGRELSTQLWMSVAFLICASSAARWFRDSCVCAFREPAWALWLSRFWMARRNWMKKIELRMTVTAIEQ